jgi:hypothetical protein
LPVSLNNVNYYKTDASENGPLHTGVHNTALGNSHLQHTPLPTRFWTKLQLPLKKPEHTKLNALPPQTNPFFWKLKPRITSLTHQKLTPGDRARLGFLEKIFQKIAKTMLFF